MILHWFSCLQHIPSFNPYAQHPTNMMFNGAGPGQPTFPPPGQFAPGQFPPANHANQYGPPEFMPASDVYWATGADEEDFLEEYYM